jgi:Protein of unknown function (DUF3501)
VTAARSRRLTLADVADLRAYEREREDFLDYVIALKRRRRVSVGPFITLMFECRDTMRFQIQEMARAERMLTDEAIEAELAAYNPLIPEPGELSATLFVELRTDAELREWLPKLVGIERASRVVVGVGPEASVVAAEPEAEHASRLTRADVTAAVHYVRFAFAPAQVAAFADGPVSVTVDHPEYLESAVLSAETRAELLADLRGPPAGV